MGQDDEACGCEPVYLNLRSTVDGGHEHRGPPEHWCCERAKKEDLIVIRSSLFCHQLFM